MMIPANDPATMTMTAAAAAASRRDMAASLTAREFDISSYYQPRAAVICNLLLVLCACSATCSFFWRRIGDFSNWRRLPIAIWMALIVYADSFCFVVGSAVLQFVYNPGQNIRVCQAAILLCIVFYLGTKLFIYLFLVERAFIIRRSKDSRLKSRWYIAHVSFVITLNLTFLILLLVYRIYLIKNDLCMVSVQHQVLVCIIIFDVGVNIYLTGLFLRPVLRSYSFQRPSFFSGKMPWSLDSVHQQPLDAQLRRLALRTFLGTCATLFSSVANLIGQSVFKAQPYWLCLLCCEADILFSAIVIHCITNNNHLAPSVRAPGGINSLDAELQGTTPGATTTANCGVNASSSLHNGSRNTINMNILPNSTSNNPSAGGGATPGATNVGLTQISTVEDARCPAWSSITRSHTLAGNNDVDDDDDDDDTCSGDQESCCSPTSSSNLRKSWPSTTTTLAPSPALLRSGGSRQNSAVPVVVHSEGKGVEGKG